MFYFEWDNRHCTASKCPFSQQKCATWRNDGGWFSTTGVSVLTLFCSLVGSQQGYPACETKEPAATYHGRFSSRTTAGGKPRKNRPTCSNWTMSINTEMQVMTTVANLQITLLNYLTQRELYLKTSVDQAHTDTENNGLCCQCRDDTSRPPATQTGRQRTTLQRGSLAAELTTRWLRAAWMRNCTVQRHSYQCHDTTKPPYHPANCQTEALAHDRL